jgi:hypothetical protein
MSSCTAKAQREKKKFLDKNFAFSCRNAVQHFAVTERERHRPGNKDRSCKSWTKQKQEKRKMKKM